MQNLRAIGLAGLTVCFSAGIVSNAGATLVQGGTNLVDARASVYDVPGGAAQFGAAGVTPWTIAFAPGDGKRIRFPSITGSIGCGSGQLVGADGGPCWVSPPRVNPDGRVVVEGANGLSGIWQSGEPSRQMALTGVFHSSRTAGRPAPTIVYDSQGAYDFRIARPALNQLFFVGDGSVRFVDDGSSFRFGDGSVRVLQDGTSNTVLIGEGNARFAGDRSSGFNAAFGDGSVRFLPEAGGGWRYERRDAGGIVTGGGVAIDGANFAFGDGSVRFLRDGSSNTVLFGESSVNLRGDNTAGWQAMYADGSLRNLGSTSRFLAGDGSVRFVSNGASFRAADGSVRVLQDGTSNTVLIGEGSAVFTGDRTSGYNASFSDGSVRFLPQLGGGWAYERRDASGALVGTGVATDGARFSFGDGSVRFLRDGSANTILFGESNVALRGDDAGGWRAAFGDGSVRFLGDGRAPLFGDGSVRFISDGTSNTVVFADGSRRPAGWGPSFYYGDGSVVPVASLPLIPWSRVGDAGGLTSILDGITNTVLVQEFVVPDDADLLTLGFIDTDGRLWPIGAPGGYADNGGALTVSYELIQVPEPPGWLSLVFGLAVMGMLRRRLAARRTG